MADILDTNFENVDVDVEGNFAEIGDDINLLQIDPTLRRITVAAGWDANSFAGSVPDIDLSLFLINAKDQTREDADFIFYNQSHALDGAIRHHGDSRTGAGDGDDEAISIDLQGVPLDIMSIVIVLSVYKGFENEQNMSMINNAFVRLVNEENGMELVRFKIDDVIEESEYAGLHVANINREGPKWHFKPIGEGVPRGLSEIAKRYGIIIGQE